MPQAPSHGSSLTVLGGPRDGASFPLGTAFEELLIGSDSSCEVFIDLPDVSPVHAKLLVEAAGVTVSDTHSPFGLFVNDDRVTAPTRLRDGDVIWLGAPGEPASVMLLCHIVAIDVPVVAPLPGGGEQPLELWDSAPAPPAEEHAFFVDPLAVAPAEVAPAAPEGELLFEIEPPPPAPAAATTPADEAIFFAEPEPAAPPAAPAPVPSDDIFFVGDAASATPEPALLDITFTDSPATPRVTPPADAFVLDLGFGDEPAAPPERSAASTPAPRAEAPPAATSPAAARPPAPGSARPSLPAAPAPAPAAAPPATLPTLPVAPPRAAPQPAAPTGHGVASGMPTSPPVAPPAAMSAPGIPATGPPAGAPAPVVPRRPRVGSATVASPAAAAPRPTGAPPAAAGPAPVPAAPVAQAPAPPRASAPSAPTSSARPTAPVRSAPATASPSPVARRTAPVPVRPRPGAPRAGSRGRVVVVAAVAALAVVLGAGGWLGWALWSTPRLDGVTPARAHSGQVVTLSGARFAGDARVLLGGQPGRVVKNTPGQLEVEVPVLSLAPGPDRPVAVVVQNGARTSSAVTLMAFIAPRLHGIAPDVALPGEDVELVGTGWGPGAEVRFGAVPAEVLSVNADTLHVRVPALEGPPGSAAPVTVTMGGASSNAAPFFVGRVPLVIGVQPAAAASGDVVVVSGRGFRAQPGATRVTLGGRPALILAAADSALSVVVPSGVGAGAAPLEVRVSGLEPVGQGTLSLPAPPAGIDLRFVAEPLDEAPDGSLAAVATELGPAFVLAASGGRTAAQRALEAQNRLNQATVAIKASRSAELEVRFGEPPSLGLRGRPEALLAATAEDAAAYAQASRRAVSPARLATWWSALARDLVLLLVRSERPHFAADLAGEGRALPDAFQAARRVAPFGVPRSVVEAKPLMAALRGLALRVPVSVPEPALATAGAPARTGAVAALRLEGAWGGRERVPEGERFIGVTFESRGGLFALEGGLTLSLPLLALERPQHDSVRFSVRLGGGVRYYAGRWDGERLRGTVSADAAGRDKLGTFELAPR